MYELNRMRLFSVGPSGARYGDVTLDLSGAGAVVGGQGDLFTEPRRRPSPSSLLMLENGGGKSVLLRLLFSVVLPGRRNAVGGSATSMEKFVVGEDPAHVVLEWMDVLTGDRLITAKTTQWRRNRAANGSRLADAWWSLRPGAGVEMETLPFVREGRHIRLDAFHELLLELGRSAPATQLTWAGDQVGVWTGHLRDLGIEPDLFAIQGRMNADEGEAAGPFKFRSSKAFVEWLLRTVLDADDAVSTAENFDSYATTVGDRRALLLEQEFVAGAVQTLLPAAEAHREFSEATDARRAAERAGLRLLGELQARVSIEDAAVIRLRKAHSAAAAEALTRETDRDRARDTVNEIRRQTLVLEVEGAEMARQGAERLRDLANAELGAWAAVPLVEDRDNTARRAGEYADRLTNAEEAARPAIAARDATAARLLSKLRGEINAATEDMRLHEKDERDHRNAAATLDDRRSDMLVAAERHRGEGRVARQTIAAARDAVDAAVATGLLQSGLSAAAGAARADDKAAKALVRLQSVETDLTSADADARERAQQAAEATIRSRDAQREHRSAESTVAQAREGGLLVANQRHVLQIMGLLVADVDALDVSAEAVADSLRHDIQDSDAALGALRDLQREDQRLLDALGDGGLLPPREEVELAVGALRDAGFAAHAGWRYLAESAPAGERSELIAANPQLADGIVLVDPNALGAARDVLITARLLPAAAVTVGTGAGLLEPDRVPRADQFVLEPTPALFDLDAAVERRAQLRPVMAERGQSIADRDAELLARRNALADLATWRRSCPPGHLVALADVAEHRKFAHQTAADEDRTARWAAATSEGRRAELADALPDLRAAERKAAEAAADLHRLRAVVATADDAQRSLGEMDDAARTADSEAVRLAELRDQELARSVEAARAAENDRDRAERHRAELGTVRSSTGELSAEVPDQPLSEVRSSYAAALAVYLTVEVGQDLRNDARSAEDAAARARGAMAAVPEQVIARAEELLKSSEGSDAPGRRAATARVERECVLQVAALGEAIARAAAFRTELTGASPGDADRKVWTTLPEDRRPQSVSHGRDLLVAARSDQRRAQEQLDDANGSAAGLLVQLESATEAGRAFSAVTALLLTVLEDVDRRDETAAAEMTLFAGSVDAAKAQADAQRHGLRSARTAELDLAKHLARLTAAVTRFASDIRFEALTDNTARRALIGLDPDVVGDRAHTYADSLAQRLASLTTDLESAAKHRQLIVKRLSSLVDGALGTLRTASRLSKLPEGLGEWTGKEFLRIRFSDPDNAVLAARTGEIVDDLAAATAARQSDARGSAPRRDGFALLLAAVDAAVPRGFTVEVLKPDAVLREERVVIEQMNEVFSGGQELTAAIVLYCTMAALRANERGRLRSRHSGVLFLDNPIGKASAEYLLDLQQGVASALGVQLIYTTGIFDDRALASFPLWVRMRNDADLRAGLKYIRVAEVVRRHLPDSHTQDAADDASPGGAVSAARLFRRPL